MQTAYARAHMSPCKLLERIDEVHSESEYQFIEFTVYDYIFPLYVESISLRLLLVPYIVIWPRCPSTESFSCLRLLMRIVHDYDGATETARQENDSQRNLHAGVVHDISKK